MSSDNAPAGEQQPQRPWASPRQQPVKGVVQPRVLPPFGKPTRHTNKLDYIMTTVLKEAGKHKHVWPFQRPVDAVALMIPLYHDRVHRPMDLKTIETRLKNTYYTSSQECIDDIEQVFNNCYTFNGREDDVTIMAQNVHEVIKKSLENGPREEHDMEVYWGKNKKKGKGGDKKKEARGQSEAPSEAGSEMSTAGEKRSKVAGKKPGKRKADSDDDEKGEPQRAKREAAVVKKEVQHTVSAAMKPCLKIINEFFGKKYADIAWPFFEPVDAVALNLFDYHKIITEPMDMKTIKKNIETGVLKEPADFERAVRLMLKNCLVYNPVGDPVHNLGKAFTEVFEKKWANQQGDSRASSTTPMPSLTAAAAPTTSKVAKQIKKEPKTEEYAGAKSEDFMQINNVLGVMAEREEKLKAELEAVAAMKVKLQEAKIRREENPNEPFPDRLLTQARSLCTPQSSSMPIANVPSFRNGRAKKAAKAHGYEFDSDDEENQKAMTYEDKRGLSMMINKLPPSHLSTIIAIIQRRENSAIDQQPPADSEIEIDFESLGDMCLREMDAFVRSVLNMKKNEDGTKKGDATEQKASEVKEKKKKNFNMSESSDDETSNSRKRRKKESSESESSSSSDDDSDDDAKNIPRKSGQPPSTSREWNQSAPPPRAAGMGGQPPMARVPPSAPPKTVSNQPAKPAASKPSKPVESKKSHEKPKKAIGNTILDSLLPDTFGTSNSAALSAPSASAPSSSADAQLELQNGENEEARIQRLRLEAKRKREKDDQNSVSMAAQMEVMSAFEYDNIY